MKVSLTTVVSSFISSICSNPTQNEHVYLNLELKMNTNLIVVNSRVALEAAAVEATKAGLNLIDLGRRLDGEAQSRVSQFIDYVNDESNRDHTPTETSRGSCWLGGGETVVTIGGADDEADSGGSSKPGTNYSFSTRSSFQPFIIIENACSLNYNHC